MIHFSDDQLESIADMTRARDLSGEPRARSYEIQTIVEEELERRAVERNRRASNPLLRAIADSMTIGST